MKPLIVANWKMNPSILAEAKRIFNSIKKGVKNVRNVDVVICPPFVYISELSVFLGRGDKKTQIRLKIGAQDMFWEEKGAFTGEISSSMLKNLGCQYVILGHSERRRIFGETDQMINKKIKAVIKAGLTPILCIGETQKERERGKAPFVLKKQIEFGLEGVSSSKLQTSGLCIAYEPIWAIGTNKPCEAMEAQTMGLLIQKIITGFYNQAVAKKLRILYGGSVNSKNARNYIKEARLNGLLIGKASLKPKELIKIVKTICEI